MFSPEKPKHRRFTTQVSTPEPRMFARNSDSEVAMASPRRWSLVAAYSFARHTACPDPDKARAWCARNLPTLSRPLLKYGRDGILGPLFALLVLFSFGRWWEWLHGGGPMWAAAAWTIAAGASLLLAKHRWFVAGCPLAWVAGQSYLLLFLEGGWRYFELGTASAVLTVTFFALGVWETRQPK